MVDSVSSSTTSVTSALQQKITDFQNGKVNITKSDLNEYAAEYKANNEEIPDSVQEIIDSYEKIDKNGDGVSQNELTTYNNQQSAISSYSEFDVSLLQYMNSSDDSTSDSLLNLVNSGISSKVSSYTEKALEKYSTTSSSSSTTSTSTELTSSSLIDYLT